MTIKIDGLLYLDGYYDGIAGNTSLPPEGDLARDSYLLGWSDGEREYKKIIADVTK